MTYDSQELDKPAFLVTEADGTSTIVFRRADGSLVKVPLSPDVVLTGYAKLSDFPYVAPVPGGWDFYDNFSRPDVDNIQGTLSPSGHRYLDSATFVGTPAIRNNRLAVVDVAAPSTFASALLDKVPTTLAGAVVFDESHGPTGNQEGVLVCCPIAYTRTIVGVTLGNPAKVTFQNPHRMINGQYAHFNGVVGTTEINNATGVAWPITIADSYNVTIPVNAVNAYVSGGTAITGIAWSSVQAYWTPNGYMLFVYDPILGNRDPIATGTFSTPLVQDGKTLQPASLSIELLKNRVSFTLPNGLVVTETDPRFDLRFWGAQVNYQIDVPMDGSGDVQWAAVAAGGYASVAA